MVKQILHPSIESGVRKGNPAHPGGMITCKCRENKVKVQIAATVAHSHACGCTKCWKPEGALFSIVAVAPTDVVTVVENGDKLIIVDKSALIQRHACRECGTHMYGPVEREHPFKGLSFVHPELFDSDKWPEPTFAAFVSSAIEGGAEPSEMGEIRERLRAIGLETYDCLSPALMDYISTWTVQKKKEVV